MRSTDARTDQAHQAHQAHPTAGPEATAALDTAGALDTEQTSRAEASTSTAALATTAALDAEPMTLCPACSLLLDEGSLIAWAWLCDGCQAKMVPLLAGPPTASGHGQQDPPEKAWGHAISPESALVAGPCTRTGLGQQGSRPDLVLAKVSDLTVSRQP